MNMNIHYYSSASNLVPFCSLWFFRCGEKTGPVRECEWDWLTQAWDSRFRHTSWRCIYMEELAASTENTTVPQPNSSFLIPSQSPASRVTARECVCLITTVLSKGPEKFFWDEIKCTFTRIPKAFQLLKFTEPEKCNADTLLGVFFPKSHGTGFST